MKNLKLTDEELRTLLWAVNNQYHHTVRQNAENGKPMRNDITERLCEISAKANAVLVGAKKAG